MKSSVALVLAFACIFALYAEATARPSDVDAKDKDKPKDIKEPKEIKESATASKDVKDAIKNAKDAKKMKKDCPKNCGTAYLPVCAHDLANPTAKQELFPTQCALDVHNCENGTKLTVKNPGECVGDAKIHA